MTILDILLNIWRPALEVIILAVGIYYALMFVRGTRGWPVVLGFLFLLLVISLVTTALDLRVLFWLLAKLLTGLAIAVLVIPRGSESVPVTARATGAGGADPSFAPGGPIRTKSPQAGLLNAVVNSGQFASR